MNPTRFVHLGALCAISLLPTGARAQTNLALGKTSFFFNQTPNAGSAYSAGDATDMTDGVRWNGSSNYTPLVGWWQRTYDPVTSFTIDLGSSQKISALTLGAIGVPAFIDTWVSDDNINYRYGGELVSQWLLNNTPAGNSATALRGSLNLNARNDFRMDNLRLQGRYVKFSTYRSSSFLFLDEAEVWSGTQTALPSSLTLSSNIEGWSASNKQGAVTRVRYLRDLQELATHTMAGTGTFGAQMTTLRQQVMNADRLSELNTTPSQGLGVSNLQKSIWSLNASMNKAAGQADHAIAPAIEYEPVHPFDTVVSNTATQTFNLSMGERRPFAINLSNNTTQSNKYADVVVNWPGGGSPPAGAIDMRAVRYTEAQEHAIVGSALPRAQQISPNTWRIPLSPGATSQIWMDLDSRSLSHGTYAMQVDVIPQGAGAMTLPVNLNVRRGRVLDNRLQLHAWDYLDAYAPSPASDTNRLNLQDMLKDYGHRSHWMQPSSLMAEDRLFPRKPDGSYNGTPSFSTFRKWLDELSQHPQGTDKYYVFLATDVLSPQYYTGGIAPGDPRYNTAVSSFFQALAAVVDEKGLDRKKFVFMPIDEPGPGSHPQEISFIQLMKQAVPQFKSAMTAGGNYNSVAALDQPLVNSMDVIIANLNATGDNEELWNYYRQVTRGDGKSLQVYVAGDGGNTRSPTNYFRRLAWEAEKRNLDAAAFWTSVRSDIPDTWDDFMASSRFETVFAKSNSPEVVPSKMLSALRDGAQDYARFKTIRLTSNDVHEMGVTRSLGWWAKRVVKTEVNNALALLPSINTNSSWQRSVGVSTAFDSTAILDALDAVDRFAPKPSNRSGDNFNQTLSAQWSRFQPNSGAATNVTTVDLTAGVLRAKQGEMIRSVQTWNLNDGELTVTGQMMGQSANGTNRLTIYNSDQSQSIDVLYNDRLSSTDRAIVRRNIAGGGSVTLVDSILPTRHELSLSPQWMAVNIDKQNLEVSLLPHNQKRVSDFEGSAYTPGQNVAGQDGWGVLSGTARVTPDAVSGYGSSYTLQGDRSLLVAGTVKRGFDAGTSFVDGSVLSCKVRLDPGSTMGFYLSDNLATGSTPAGIEFASGTVKGFAASSSNPATGMIYENNLEYLISMELNFTNDRFKIWVEDPQGRLFETTGNYNFYTALTPSDVLDDGGIFLTASGAAIFDDIQVTSPVTGAPSYLLYSGPHGMTSGLDSVRVALGNLGTAVGEEAYWDNLSVSQLLNYTSDALPGDANLDHHVNTLDFNILAGNFGLSSRIWVTGDFDHNELCDSIDFNLLMANYGRAAAPSLGTIVPEPSSLAGLASLAALYRRPRSQARTTST